MKNKLSDIYLISPGFKVPPSDLESTLEFWAKNSPSLNLHFVPRHLSETSGDLLCSGTLSERLSEIELAFSDEKTQVVWALRGGYGSQELMPHLSKIKTLKNKLFIGFSDCTSLHYYFNQTLRLSSLHAPHPNTFFKNMHSSSVLDSMNEVFKQKDPEFLFSGLELLNKKKIKKSKGPISIEGEVGGGNLTTLISLIGTPGFEGFKEKFLFLEELEEPAYKVRRMLEHLKQSGSLDKVKALIFGHMIHTSSNQQELIKKVVIEFCENLEVPSVWGLSSGHEHFENHPLWFGKKSKLTLDESSTLVNNIKCESIRN